jgi:pectate disaccharide-lyase
MRIFKSRKMFSTSFFGMILMLSVVCSFSTANGQVEGFDGWKSVIFGQSADRDKNSIVIDAANKSATLVAGDKGGTIGGGKVTSSHDGISYFYHEVDPSKNFVLSAKVKVNFFAKATPDNQEAFGIMARDRINKDNDSSVFPSNMVMIGGYRGYLQSVLRNKVVDPSGAGAKMEDVEKFGGRPNNDGTTTYLLKMRKTNTGYHVSVDNGNEFIYYRPKAMEVLDKEKVYVGFFAARVASITVSDIAFSTSDVATDPKGEPEPKREDITDMRMLSPSGSAYQDYTFRLLVNKTGTLDIKINNKTKFFGKNPKPGIFERTYSLEKGYNTFNVSFTPGPEYKNTDEIVLERNVIYKTFAKDNGIIFASPTGIESSDGTIKDPVDINTAVKYARPGQTVLLSGGIYNLSTKVIVEIGNDGLNGKLKTLKGDLKKRTILNFGTLNEGVTLLGNYWKFENFDITQAKASGLKVTGNHNIIERINTYSNGDTGMTISGFSLGFEKWTSVVPGVNPKDWWPSQNLILNCESYNNVDISENNADGFSAKLTCGPGNVFRGCISHNNCDDGWDLYSKLETGPISPVVIENCVSYGNGTLIDGRVTKGDGNGFKLGGEGLAVKHMLRNSLSFGNKSAGITNNSDPAVIVENTTSVDNGEGNYSFDLYSKAVPQFSIKNAISFRTKSGPDDRVIDAIRGADNYYMRNKVTENSDGKRITAADFESVKFTPITLTKTGTFKDNKFMNIAPSSTLKGGANINDFSNITKIQD